MKSNAIKISTPEAIALAERMAQLKRERREESQRLWADGKLKLNQLKPAVFTLKRKDV